MPAATLFSTYHAPVQCLQVYGFGLSLVTSLCTLMSSGFRFLSQVSNFVEDFSLLPVPPVAARQLSDPKKFFLPRF